MITSKAMARKIFAPILATLMVAGLSTGLASPAKADNVSNTITIHYQDPAATGFDSYKDWNMWLWTNGTTTSSVNSPGYWNGSDSYGKSHTFTIADSAGVTSLGAIVRTDNWDKIDCAMCEWGGNRTINLDASGHTDVWILKGGDEQVYTSLAAAQAAGAGSAPWADGDVDPNFDCDSNNVCVPHVVMPANQHVVIHYQDPAATKFSSYKNWDVFVFSGGSNHPNGNYFNGSDAFGKVLDLNFTNMDRIKGIGVIVRKTNWSDRAGWKDGTGDAGADGKGGNRVLPLSLSSGENEFWIVRGADKDAYYTSLAAAQAAGAGSAPWAAGAVDPGYGSDGLPVAGYPVNQTFTIHYNRADGNYGDWNIWMWGTGTALDGGQDFTGTDAYGRFVTLEVPGANDSLVSGFGYLLRSTHDWSNAAKNAPNGGNQDAVDNVSIPDGGKTAGLTEIWVKQGDARSYTSNPFPTPSIATAPSAAAYGQAIAITGNGLTGSRVQLVRAAVPAVTATKVGSAYKCGTVTRSLGYVCTPAVTAATVNAVSTVISATKIVAAFPNAGAITGKIVVTNPAGSATSAGNFALSTSKGSVAISTFTSKGVVGDTVTVTGNNVGAATGVKLGTLDISNFASTDVNSLTFAVPAGATDGKITVTTAGGSVSSAAAFALVPSITSVSSSAAIGGTVTVTGINLGAVNSVKLGTKAVTSFTKGATSISFTVPTGFVTGTVTVASAGGSSTSSASVTVIQKPTVTAVTGAKVGAIFTKGATLTITGINLSGATSVLIGASAIAQGNFTVVNSTTITFTAPAGKSGKVSVITPGGTGTGSVTITTAS